MGKRLVVHTRADWIRVLEAVHAPAADDLTWAWPVNQALAGLFPRAMGAGIIAVEHSSDFGIGRPVLLAPPPALPDVTGLTEQLFGHFGPQAVRAYFYPEQTVTTHGEIARGVDPELASAVAAMDRSFGVSDAIGMTVSPEPGVALVAYVVFEEPVTLTPYERRLLTQVALHLDAAYRLRRRPEVVVAELSGDGRVLGHADGAPVELLERHVARVARARARSSRRSADAVGLWPALASGRLSLVDRRSGGRRSYLVVENPLAVRGVRALSKPEVDALTMAARGLSTKLVAYSLGVSPSTVSARLAASAAKLGVATRDDVIRLAALLTGTPNVSIDEPRLTEAERDVLDLLRRGMSNREIAAARSRSVRTVANQVASLLRKTQTPSRRGLLVGRRPGP